MLLRDWIIKVNCVFLLYSVKTSESLGRIVGGEKTTAEEFPFVASLRFQDTHVCGASIVSSRYILTAAHCMVRISGLLMTVVVGISSQHEKGDVYFVDFPIIHSFNLQNGANDIALLRTTHEIRFSRKVQPVKITDVDVHESDHPVTMIGWGRLLYDSPIAEFLQKVELKIVRPTVCRWEWNFVNERHICVGTSNNQGSCLGDSGGPIIAYGRQIGIISFGKMCAVGKPDVATRVFRYSDWILSYLTL